MLADTLRRVSIMGATVTRAQHKRFGMAGGTASAAITLDTAVDPAKSFVIPTPLAITSGGIGDTPATIYFTTDLAADGASVTVTRGNATPSINAGFHVVELGGDVKVTKQTFVFSGTATTIDLAITTALEDYTKTFPAFSTYVPNNGYTRFWQLDKIVSNTAVRFARGEGFNQSQTAIIYFVEF